MKKNRNELTMYRIPIFLWSVVVSHAYSELMDREAAGVSVVVAIDGSLLDRERAGHRRMNGTDEGVGAGVELVHVVGLGRHAGEDRALEDLGPGRRALVDRDVVRDAVVLVVELDLERRAGLRRQVRSARRRCSGP